MAHQHAVLLPQVVVHPHKLVHASGHEPPLGALGDDPRRQGGQGHDPVVVVCQGVCVVCFVVLV